MVSNTWTCWNSWTLWTESLLIPANTRCHTSHVCSCCGLSRKYWTRGKHCPQSTFGYQTAPLVHYWLPNCPPSPLLADQKWTHLAKSGLVRGRPLWVNSNCRKWPGLLWTWFSMPKWSGSFLAGWSKSGAGEIEVGWTKWTGILSVGCSGNAELLMLLHNFSSRLKCGPAARPSGVKSLKCRMAHCLEGGTLHCAYSRKGFGKGGPLFAKKK